MKEAPIFIPQKHTELTPIESALTQKAASPRLDRGGTIFMSQTPGVGEGSTAISEKPAVLSSAKPAVAPEARTARQDPEHVLGGSAWQQALEAQGYSKREINDPATQQAIEIATRAGIAPKLSEEVLANARLDDPARLEEARKLLQQLSGGKPLTQAQEKALAAEGSFIKAHRNGEGEVGKDGGEVGVGNYKVSQLLRKARKLKGEEKGVETFSKQERRAFMEKGLAGRIPAPSGTYTATATGDPQAQAIADYLEQRAARGGHQISDRDLHAAQEFTHEAARENIINGLLEPDQIRNLSAQVAADLRSAGGDDQEIRRHLQLYLMGNDLDLLSQDEGRGATEWLNGQFDTIFQGAESGQELDSPVLRQLEQKIAYAIAYLNYRYADRPDIAEVFFRQYTYREKLMVMRVIIGQKNQESLLGVASSLRMKGLLSSFGFEDQNVRRVYQRMSEKLEDMRLNVVEAGFEKNVGPELVRKMQTAIEDEELRLFVSLQDKSSYWEMVKDVKEDVKKGDTSPQDAQVREARNAIRRSVRTAYDLFVASQREAIIVARGRQPLDEAKGYRSVPSALFAFINPETMMWGGWNMLNVEASAFFDRLKIDIAEEALKERKIDTKSMSRYDKIEYGARLYRDLSPISDFYTGIWRREPMMEQHQKLIEFKVAAAPVVEGWKNTYGVTKSQIKELLNRHQVTVTHGGVEYTLIPREAPVGVAASPNTIYLGTDIVRIEHNFQNPSKADMQRAGEAGKDLGLFFKLRAAGNGEDMRTKKENRDQAKQVLEQITERKPEEIIRILKDRIPVRKVGALQWHNELKDVQEALRDKLGLPDTSALATVIKTGDGATPFDIFRQEYGGVITLLRENALREYIPRAADLRHLNADEIALVDQAMGAGAARKLMDAYEVMQDYITGHKIKDALTGQKKHVADLLVSDYRFEDIFNRVISVDDVLLDELEDLPAISGLMRVSDMISTDPAGDGYRRAMNDASDGIKALTGLYNFLKFEDPELKMKAADEYAEGLGSANGQGAIAKAIRFTYGTYLDLMKPYYWLDVAGLKKLPFRIPASEIEKIYGPEAHTKEREELRQIIDEKLRSKLAEAALNADLKDKVLYERGLLTTKEVEQRKKERIHSNEKQLHSLKSRIGVTRKDELKRKSLEAILIILFFLLGESLEASQKLVSDVGIEGGGGGGHAG